MEEDESAHCSCDRCIDDILVAIEHLCVHKGTWVTAQEIADLKKKTKRQVNWLLWSVMWRRGLVNFRKPPYPGQPHLWAMTHTIHDPAVTCARCMVDEMEVRWEKEQGVVVTPISDGDLIEVHSI